MTFLSLDFNAVSDDSHLPFQSLDEGDLIPEEVDKYFSERDIRIASVPLNNPDAKARAMMARGILFIGIGALLGAAAFRQLNPSSILFVTTIILSGGYLFMGFTELRNAKTLRLHLDVATEINCYVNRNIYHSNNYSRLVDKLFPRKKFTDLLYYRNVYKKLSTNREEAVRIASLVSGNDLKIKTYFSALTSGAIATHSGNCEEMAIAGCEYAAQNYPQIKVEVIILKGKKINGKKGDHITLAIGRSDCDLNDYNRWGPCSVGCGPWENRHYLGSDLRMCLDNFEGVDMGVEYGIHNRRRPILKKFDPETQELRPFFHSKIGMVEEPC
jgi:hypothetical protein